MFRLVFFLFILYINITNFHLNSYYFMQFHSILCVRARLVCARMRLTSNSTTAQGACDPEPLAHMSKKHTQRHQKKRQRPSKHQNAQRAKSGSAPIFRRACEVLSNEHSDTGECPHCGKGLERLICKRICVLFPYSLVIYFCCF